MLHINLKREREREKEFVTCVCVIENTVFMWSFLRWKYNTNRIGTIAYLRRMSNIKYEFSLLPLNKLT